MAASAWKIYSEAKKYLVQAELDLDAGGIRVKLVNGTSAAKVSDFSRSTFASCGGPVAVSGAGNNTRTPANLSIRLSSTSILVLDFDNVIFTASGALNSILYAVIGVSGGKCLGWTKLTSSGVITLTAGSTLTITPNAAVFSLRGGST